MQGGGVDSGDFAYTATIDVTLRFNSWQSHLYFFQHLKTKGVKTIKIKVIGKKRLQGTSKKTGNPYNFIQIHHISPARGVEGMAARTFSLAPNFMLFDDTWVNGEYDVEFNQGGYVISFLPCNAPVK